MTDEKFIEAEACLRLRAMGCTCIKQEPPWPDRLVIYAPGRHVFIEFKTLTGRLRKTQVIINRQLTERGETVFVCRTAKDACEKISRLIRPSGEGPR
jgi:hypothetical protein